MTKHDVRNPSDALAYTLDCGLATVSDMASKKKRPSGEYARQVSIAQITLDWCREYGCDISGTRGFEVVNQYAGSVEEWAKKFFPKQNSDFK